MAVIMHFIVLCTVPFMMAHVMAAFYFHFMIAGGLMASMAPSACIFVAVCVYLHGRVYLPPWPCVPASVAVPHKRSVWLRRAQIDSVLG